MKIATMVRTIREGDVINQKHVVESFTISFANCTDGTKFWIGYGSGRKKEQKILEVSRAGETYFVRQGRGGANNV